MCLFFRGRKPPCVQTVLRFKINVLFYVAFLLQYLHFPECNLAPQHRANLLNTDKKVGILSSRAVMLLI